MPRRRCDSTKRSLRWGVVVGAAAAAFVSTSVALAAFTATVTGGGVAAYSTKRIFAGVRSTSAWTIRDASGGGAEATNDDALSYSGDGRTTTTGSAWTTTFSATRYLEFDFNSALPDGLAVSSPQLNLRMASTNNASSLCFYVEVYRVSTATLIGTHGSAGTPYACNSGTTQTTTNIALPEVSTTTVANDLRVRVYITDSKSKTSATDMVTIAGSTPYSSFTDYEDVYRDRSSGTVAATNWGISTSGDGANYLNAAAWASAFSTSRYVKFTFDPSVPTGAVITSATLDFFYRSNSTGTTCWYFETYNGATLLGTHGSSGTPLSCKTGNTAYTTDNVSLAELTNVADANALTVKVYMKDSLLAKAQIDLVQLNLNYYLD
jgi:hypothetical protein